MNFKPDLAELILSGRKTQTRRLVRGDEPCRYVAGKDYAVCPGRGKHAIGRIAVHNVALERVIEISETDAYCEGFRSTAEFFDRWSALYGDDADMQAFVWVIRFTLLT